VAQGLEGVYNSYNSYNSYKKHFLKKSGFIDYFSSIANPVLTTKKA
jgi:hypothetical protein